MIIDINSNQNEDEKLNSEKKIWILQRPTIIQTIWICDLSLMCDYNAGTEDMFALMLVESYIIFPHGWRLLTESQIHDSFLCNFYDDCLQLI